MSTKSVCAAEIDGQKPPRRIGVAQLSSLKEPLSYLFHLELTHTQELQVGARAGELYQAGHYYYSGSAKRYPGHRLLRHWRGSLAKHWHIDYLREQAQPQAIYLFLANKIDECSLAEHLQEAGLQVILGFGSSDCSCAGHLWYQKSPFLLEGYSPLAVELQYVVEAFS